MHLRELVELAALVATHAPARIRCGTRFPDPAVREYWAVSKCRFQHWTREIKKSFSGPLARAKGPRAERRPSPRPLLEEILVSEILTRVFTAVGCGCDRACGADEAGPILLNVWSNHLESRHRVLNLMVSGRGLRMEDAVALNRLRRTSERWTDMLLSYFAGECPVDRFAFNSRRVHEYAQDLQASENSDLAWSLLRASLQASYQRGLSLGTPSVEMNTSISAAILSCFQEGLFDATGSLKSLWMVRIEQLTNETKGMIEDLLSPQPAPPVIQRDLPLRGRFGQL